MARAGDFEKQRSNYDLENNYVLVNKVLEGEDNVSLIAVIIPHHLLPREIESVMSTVTRVSQIVLLSVPIKDMLLFLYFYFYLPILSLGILIFYIKSKNISEPIGQLNEAVKSISRDNFNFRIDVKGDNEIAELIHSFKYMTKELLFNRAKLRRMSQMEAWKDVAVRLAHELKNPLTPIKLANDKIGKKVMKSDFDLYSELLPSFNLVNREISTIGELIKQFSRYSKDLELEKVRLNMHQFTETLKDYLTHHSQVKWDFINNIHPEINCLVDERGLRQVVTNLVSNAVDNIKGFSPGRLGIRGKCLDQHESAWVELSVSNNGPAIPENLKDKIFEPYFTTKESGTGLGLAICERIIAKHQGHLNFSSTPGNTVFTIRIPTVP